MDNKQFKEKIMFGAAFLFFFLITCHKLTYSPLWYDETIEFWYSKIMIGELPFEGVRLNASTNMYQRIVSTYQPPLYNVIMHFWLKLGTTEWWFRFFGVVMGAIGNIGIYKTVKKISNTYTAAGAFFLSSCVPQLVYYWQECAEYCLMLGTLCWTIYSFICLLEEPKFRNIIIFTILSILPVYSQYGAMFPVGTMIIIAYIFILLKKDKKNIIAITISYIIALVFAAIPLIYFFMIRQVNNQHNGTVHVLEFSVNGNIFYDMFLCFKTIVSWNLFYNNELIATVFSWIFIICIILLIIISKKTYVKLLAIANIITWLIYYFAVKFGMYSYGLFGSRYNLFFIPLWLISLFCFGYQIYELLRMFIDEKIRYSSYIFIGICVIVVIFYMFCSWTKIIRYNWNKSEDMRTAVNLWLENGAQYSHTIVYYAGDSGFAYYLRTKDNYSPEMENNVVYMPWMRAKTVREYKDYINSLYGDEWPLEIYIIGTHTQEDISVLASVFIDNGYDREELSISDFSLMRLKYIGSK